MRFMAVSMAASISGIPERTLRRWCVEGKLPARRRAGIGYWQIDLQALKEKGGIAESELAFQLVAGRLGDGS